MHPPPELLVITLAFSLVACNVAPPAPDGAPEPVVSPSPVATAAPSGSASDAFDDGYPDLTPPVLVPQAAKSEQGARNALLSFARALELGEFRQAHAMLGENARGRVTQQKFVSQFADLGQLSVAVPGGVTTSEAGSLYYEAPATVTGTRGAKLTGKIVLRRANDLGGANAQRRRWHIERVDLVTAR